MLNLFNPNQIYQIKIEINDFSNGLDRFENIYCLLNRFPIYQMKYFEMMSFYINKDYKTPEYFNDYSKLEKVSTIKFHNNLPIFDKLLEEDLKIIKEYYNEKQLLNYNYVQAKICEKESKYSQALKYYEEGIKLKEQFSMLAMFKILVDPLEAQKYSIEKDLKKGLNILVDNFIENGVFDNVSKSKETIYGVYLFYVFLDCFPEFFDLAINESKTNPLLEFFLLQSLEDNNIEIPQIMKNIEFFLGPKKDLLLGDLYHSYFLGISNELELNIRQSHYHMAIKQGKFNAYSRTGWINQIYLDIFLKKYDGIEGRISSEEQNNKDLEQEKTNILDFINKTKKNYISSFSFLKKKPNLKYTEEFLNFLIETNENLLPDEKNDKNSCFYQIKLLYSLGREEILSDLFNLLKMKLKIQGKSAEIIEEMKKIALKLRSKSNSEISYCMEKGLGFDKNIAKVFHQYHDEIFLFYEDFSKFIHCLYRMGKILEKIENLKEYGLVFFEICLLKIIVQLKNNIHYESIYYLAKLYRRKSFKNDEKYSTILLSFLQEKLSTRPHLDYKLKVLLYQTNYKLKMFNPEIKKINFHQIKEKESIYLDEIIKKQAIYDYYINDDFASYINQTFRTIILKINEGNLLESTLSPNLKYKITSSQPEFSPFILKKLRKLEYKNHFFNETDIIYSSFNESDNLMYGTIKKNNQKVVAKGCKFGLDEIDRMIDFLNRIDFYIKLNCNYLLSIVGISYSLSTDNSLTFYILFESFSDLFDSYLKKNQTSYDPMNEFAKILETIINLENSGLFSIGFNLSNFCISSSSEKLLFGDFDLNLLYKDYKIFLDISNQEKILHLLEAYSSPELFKAFFSKSERMNISKASFWPMVIGFIEIFTKMKTFSLKNNYILLEKSYWDKIEIQIQEILTNEITIKQYSEILKKFVVNPDKTLTLPSLASLLKIENLNNKLFNEEILSLNAFKKIEFDVNSSSSKENSQTNNKKLFYLPRKNLYEGEIKEKIPHGNGSFSNSLLSYEGKFENGKFEGYGRYKSYEWDIMYDGKFSENIARHGVMHLIQNQKGKENTFDNHSYTEFEKEYYLPNIDTINLMLNGFEPTPMLLAYNPTDILEKIKQYKNFFDVFLKNKDKYQKSIEYNSNIFYFKDQELKEFVIRKFQIIENFTIIYNEAISNREIFYFDQICFGFFFLEKKVNNISNLFSLLFESQLLGSLISYFGKKICGSFLSFKPLFGYKFNNFTNYSSFDNSKTIYAGTLKLLTPCKRNYFGYLMNEKAYGYGEETFNENYIYKGFYLENEPHGKGILQEKTGRVLIKGYFKKGLPFWGTYHKDREIKYKGNFSFSKEGTIFSFSSFKQLVDCMIIKGFLMKNDEKIFAQYGTFQNLDEENISGFSKIEYKNGAIFEGFFQNSIKKGKGTLSIKKSMNDFVIASGDWENDKLKGTIKWDKNNEYLKSSGFFTFNENNVPQMEGYGLIFFKNESYYSGGFKEGRLHGFGELELKFGDKGKSKVFIGEFDEGKKSGYGVLKENDNDILTFKGKFKNNKKNGFGILYKKDEKYLEGLFEDGVFKSGWLFVANDKVIEKVESCQFEYIENKEIYLPKGYGTIFLKDGCKIECFLENSIEDIIEKKFKRIGILITESGSFYEGLIDMFKIQTCGTYKNGDKILYEGEFKFGLFQGYGKLFDKSGKMYCGFFEKGMKNGFGKEDDGENLYWGYWKNGLKQGFGKVDRLIDDKKEEFFVLNQGLKINKIIKI